MTLKPSFLVWTLCAMFMSEIEISTPMPATIIKGKSWQFPQRFPCHLLFLYCTGSYKQRCCLLPWQCCWHKTQMHSVSFLVFFFPTLHSHLFLIWLNHLSHHSRIEHLVHSEVKMLMQLLLQRSFFQLSCLWNFWNRLTAFWSCLKTWQFSLCSDCKFCKIPDSNHGDIARINRKKAFIKGEAHLTCRNLNLCIRKQSKILIGWDEIC